MLKTLHCIAKVAFESNFNNKENSISFQFLLESRDIANAFIDVEFNNKKSTTSNVEFDNKKSIAFNIEFDNKESIVASVKFDIENSALSLLTKEQYLSLSIYFRNIFSVFVLFYKLSNIFNIFIAKRL